MFLKKKLFLALNSNFNKIRRNCHDYKCLPLQLIRNLAIFFSGHYIIVTAIKFIKNILRREEFFDKQVRQVKHTMC